MIDDVRGATVAKRRLSRISPSSAWRRLHG